MKKSHVIFTFLFSFLLFGLNFLPKVVKAASDDYFRATVQDSEIYRLARDGAIFVSSGLWSFQGLFVDKVDYINLPKSSATGVIGPVAFVIATGTLFGNSDTSKWQGTTFYSLSTGAANITQPAVPRTLRFKIDFGTGFAVVNGTDTFGNPVTETIYISSDKLPANGNIAFIGISSITITVSTISRLEYLTENTTFHVGTSTGFGLPFRVDSASDVFKVSSGSLHLPVSNYSVNPAFNTISISSTVVNGGTTFSIWGIIRRTINAYRSQ